MLRFVLLALVFFVVALLGIAAMQPAEFRVERSASMAAPVGEVFAQVNDLHNWQQWSPWAKRELVRIKLVFLKPFEATNDVVFRFAPEGENTRVTWSMTGNNNFIAKAVHMVMDMDKMVGDDFEQGLAQLKALVEVPSRP